MAANLTDSQREEFVREWNRAESLLDACVALGIEPNAAKQKASRMRALGHELKRFAVGRKPGVLYENRFNGGKRPGSRLSPSSLASFRAKRGYGT